MATEVKITRWGIFPRVSRPVFILSVSVIGLFIAYGAAFTESAEAFFGDLQDAIVVSLGWYYTLVVTFFLGFVIWLLFSRFGDVRLGDPDEQPRYSYMGWFAMLFSAGMGIGLLFWSVAEPISHYMDPPVGQGEELGAAEVAMRTTFFHWGLHAWAIYIVVGLSLAYFGFRQKLPLSIRSTFYPILGDAIYGWPGHVIDTLAVFGTMFGVATSLGLGVIQVNAGLNFLFGVEKGAPIQLLLIAVITLFATGSVLLGLNKGIKRLSQLNIWLSGLLLTVLLVLGPTAFILDMFVESTGRYLQNLVQMSLWTDALRSTGWSGDWTIFYWGWWIAWSPFVGMFIARVSRGRTIREFIIGVLFAPTLATFVWLSIFGGTALNLELFHGGGIAAAVDADVATALYVTLEGIPLSQLTAAVATLVVATYFVTSSDSGSLVIDMLTAGGDPDPPKIQRLFWAVLEGVVAAILLVAGGLTALQTAAISSGLPFSLIMVVMCYALVKGLRSEPIYPSPAEREPEAPRSTMGDTDYEHME